MTRTPTICHVLVWTMLSQATALSVQPTTAIATPRALTHEFPAKKLRGVLKSAAHLEGKEHEEENNLPADLMARGGEALMPPLSTLRTLYQSYLRAIEERPFLTKGITAAVVNFFGDILAQSLEASKAGTAFVPNWIRLQGFFLCGLIYTGPYVHAWYQQLWKVGSWMERKFDSPNQVQTMAQLILDQTIGVCIFFSTYFYVYEIIDALVSRRCKSLQYTRQIVVCLRRCTLLIHLLLCFALLVTFPAAGSARLVFGYRKGHQKLWPCFDHQLLLLASH
jgi:hypothetical protein